LNSLRKNSEKKHLEKNHLLCMVLKPETPKWLP
jgi:hypothetical protein